jgi:hypothetical protein
LLFSVAKVYISIVFVNYFRVYFKKCLWKPIQHFTTSPRPVCKIFKNSQELPLVALQIQKIQANWAVGFSLRSGLAPMEGKILLFFSLKNKKFGMRAGKSFKKSTRIIEIKIKNVSLFLF